MSDDMFITQMTTERIAFQVLVSIHSQTEWACDNGIGIYWFFHVVALPKQNKNYQLWTKKKKKIIKFIVSFCYQKECA